MQRTKQDHEYRSAVIIKDLSCVMYVNTDCGKRRWFYRLPGAATSQSISQILLLQALNEKANCGLFLPKQCVCIVEVLTIHIIFWGNIPGSITAWTPSNWILKRFLDGSTKNKILSFMFPLFIASEGLHQRCIFKVNRSATLADFSGKTRGNCRSTLSRRYKELKHGDEVQHHINPQSKFQPPKNEKKCLESGDFNTDMEWHSMFSEMAGTPSFLPKCQVHNIFLRLNNLQQICDMHNFTCQSPIIK